MSLPIRILHLERLQPDAIAVESILKNSCFLFEYLWVTDEATFKSALCGFKPDIVLADVTQHGPGILQAPEVTEDGGENIAFIIITDPANEGLAVKLTDERMGDYILKDRLQRLPVAIKNAVNKTANKKQKEAYYTRVFNINEKLKISRKADEASLRKSEANLRAIFDNTDISYVFVNRENRIISFNQKAVAIYKTAMDQDIKAGDDLLGYAKKENLEITRTRFESVLEGSKISYEVSFAGEDATAWYAVNMMPVRDTSDNVLGFILSSEDITARKLIELEKLSMTSEILKHNKDLEQFTYIVSHNLRSPVANIIALTGLLRGSANAKPGDFEKYLDGLTLSAGKLDELIIDLNFILQARRGATGKKELLTFTGIIDDMKIIISDLADKNISIRTDFLVDEMLTVKSYIHSIFTNLITNSIKYRSPSRNAEIFIQTRKEEGRLIISYSDNGLGIDMALHGNKLFGLYKRFHNHVEGKGMGLYLVKTQLEMLGGKISVTSEVDKGTEFLITFVL